MPFFPNYSGPQQCLEGSLLGQEILGNQFDVYKEGLCEKNEHVSKKNCWSPCPKKIKPLIKPLLKNSFSTNFQGTGP